jgi:hypothetical protein
MSVSKLSTKKIQLHLDHVKAAVKEAIAKADPDEHLEYIVILVGGEGEPHTGEREYRHDLSIGAHCDECALAHFDYARDMFVDDVFADPEVPKKLDS